LLTWAADDGGELAHRGHPPAIRLRSAGQSRRRLPLR